MQQNNLSSLSYSYCYSSGVFCGLKAALTMWATAHLRLFPRAVLLTSRHLQSQQIFAINLHINKFICTFAAWITHMF